MNWLTNVVRPKIRSLLRREVPENLWIKCPETGQLVFYKDVEANQFVIPASNYHMRMGAVARLKSMFDGEKWLDIGVPEVHADPLRFRDERRYIDRLKDARTKTGLNDAIKLGFGKLEGLPVVIGVQDFDFMGGSLGMAAGEAVVKGLRTAAEKGTPFIMLSIPGQFRQERRNLGVDDAHRPGCATGSQDPQRGAISDAVRHQYAHGVRRQFDDAGHVLGRQQPRPPAREGGATRLSRGALAGSAPAIRRENVGLYAR